MASDREAARELVIADLAAENAQLRAQRDAFLVAFIDEMIDNSYNERFTNCSIIMVCKNPRYSLPTTGLARNSKARQGSALTRNVRPCSAYIARVHGTLVNEFTEVESGRKADRPQFAAARDAARAAARRSASRSSIGFARTSGSSSRCSPVTPFTALDLPGATRTSLLILMTVAEGEALAASEHEGGARGAQSARRATRLAGESHRRLTERARSRSGKRRHESADGACCPDLAWQRAGWTLTQIAAELSVRDRTDRWTTRAVLHVLATATHRGATWRRRRCRAAETRSPAETTRYSAHDARSAEPLDRYCAIWRRRRATSRPSCRSSPRTASSRRAWRVAAGGAASGFTRACGFAIRKRRVRVTRRRRVRGRAA